MATGKSCSRWFAPVMALLMVVSLSGCFDKEGDQRKAFIDFLQNTAMRSGERTGMCSRVWSVPVQVGSQPWSAVRIRMS